MKAKIVRSELFTFDENGPGMIQWLTVKDLLLPEASRGDEPATICGAT